jgi:hypothetical protein
MKDEKALLGSRSNKERSTYVGVQDGCAVTTMPNDEHPVAFNTQREYKVIPEWADPKCLVKEVLLHVNGTVLLGLPAEGKLLKPLTSMEQILVFRVVSLPLRDWAFARTLLLFQSDLGGDRTVITTSQKFSGCNVMYHETLSCHVNELAWEK